MSTRPSLRIAGLLLAGIITAACSDLSSKLAALTDPETAEATASSAPITASLGSMALEASLNRIDAGDFAALSGPPSVVATGNPTSGTVTLDFGTGTEVNNATVSGTVVGTYTVSGGTSVSVTQPLPEFGPLVVGAGKDGARGEVAAALGLEPGDLVTSLPIEVVSSGLPVLFVPLETRRAVDGVTFDLALLHPVLARHQLDDLPVFVFSLETGHDDATAYSRMFAPAFGIPEDPATGGASGPLGAYLVRHRAVRAGTAQMVSLQGVAMGRPSRVHISIASSPGGDDITSVQVGGAAVLVAEGVLYV